MKPVIHGQKGFTLLEIIVVLAVLGALSAMLTPVVFRYIDDANRTRAQGDTNTIAAAIQQMYKDTGRWPFYKVGTGPLTYAAATDAAILTSNHTGCSSAAPVAMSCDTTAPVTGTGWGSFSTSLVSSLTNQLIANGITTAYSTSGGRAWKGPYLDAIPALDPWGRSYVVNIANADPNTEGSGQLWVIVASAGPDGNLDTTASTAGTANPAVGGDDVIARVK